MSLIKKYFTSIVSLMLAIVFVSCNMNEIKLLKESEVIEKKCLLKNADHGHGILYNLTYNNSNELTNIDGFPDFDQLQYQNSLPVKAISSFDKSYYIAYEYDSKGALSFFNFIGQDSRNKPFEFKSKVYTNAKKEVERIDLTLPSFDEVIVTKLEYDENSNIKKILLVENGVSKTILENFNFDNKKAPYLNTPLRNTMIYFTIYTLLIGSENTTYFANKNNPASTKIYSDNNTITYTYNNQYNSDDYITKIKVNKKTSTKEENYEENFTYDCK